MYCVLNYLLIAFVKHFFLFVVYKLVKHYKLNVQFIYKNAFRYLKILLFVISVHCFAAICSNYFWSNVVKINQFNTFFGLLKAVIIDF